MSEQAVESGVCAVYRTNTRSEYAIFIDFR